MLLHRSPQHDQIRAAFLSLILRVTRAEIAFRKQQVFPTIRKNRTQDGKNERLEKNLGDLGTRNRCTLSTFLIVQHVVNSTRSKAENISHD